jgi:hypothetical protein
MSSTNLQSEKPSFDNKYQLCQLINSNSTRISTGPMFGESAVRQHFTTIIIDSCKVADYVCCRRCKRLIKFTSAKGALGHLSRHLKGCAGEVLKMEQKKRRVTPQEIRNTVGKREPRYDDELPNTSDKVHALRVYTDTSEDTSFEESDSDG